MRARPSLARGPALACACESVSGECIRSAALASAILFHLPSPRRAHRLLYATAVHTKGAAVVSCFPCPAPALSRVSVLQ
jgi:hypothetical protein